MLTPEEALQKAKNICSRQEKCKSEIISKLHQWKISEKHTDSILKTLEKQKYIDEKRYAEYFVNSKIRIAKWGKNKIAYNLSGKQIPDGFIQNALDRFDNDEYQELVLSEIQKKARTIRYQSKQELQCKLFSFCQGRGYESGIFHEMISDIIGKDKN